MVANWPLLLKVKSPNTFFTHHGDQSGCSLKHYQVLGGVAHPCRCKLLLKLRLDIVLGESSAPLSVLANIFSWCWFENL